MFHKRVRRILQGCHTSHTNTDETLPLQALWFRNVPPFIGDDHLRSLGSYNVLFLIDNSGSIVGILLDQAAKALADIAPICTKYDDLNIRLLFTNELDKPGKTSYIKDESPAVDYTVLQRFTAIKSRIQRVIKWETSRLLEWLRWEFCDIFAQVQCDEGQYRATLLCRDH